MLAGIVSQTKENATWPWRVANRCFGGWEQITARMCVSASSTLEGGCHRFQGLFLLDIQGFGPVHSVEADVKVLEDTKNVLCWSVLWHTELFCGDDIRSQRSRDWALNSSYTHRIFTKVCCQWRATTVATQAVLQVCFPSLSQQINQVFAQSGFRLYNF